MLSICNAGCNKEFEVTKFKTTVVDGDVEKVYFGCPHCGHEYIAFYSDTEVKRLQEKMRKIHSKMSNPDFNQNVLVKQEQRTKAEIKRRMDELKAKYGG